MNIFKTIYSMFKRKPVLPEGFIVEDVDKDAHKAFIGSYTQEEKRLFWFVLFFWVLITCMFFYWFYMPDFNLNQGDFVIIFVVVLGIPIGIVTKVERRYNSVFKNLFFQQFALNHSLTYSKTENIKDEKCALFNIGHSPEVSKVFTGELHSIPLKLFYYIYTVGSGKHKEFKQFSVIRLVYNFTLPPVLLVVDNQYFGGIKPAFSNSVKIKTDDKLDSRFDLFTKEQYEIEVLQIFNPSFINQMIENWPHCNLEFVGNNVYIYTPSYLTNKAKIEKLFALSDFITSGLSKTLKTISGSVKALNELERR